MIAALISRALHDESIEIWDDGSVVRDFIFIDDVIEALLAAARDRSDMRIFNVGSGKGHSISEVVLTIESLLGKNLRILSKPSRPLDVPVSVLAIDRAKDVLRWMPRTPFKDGLEKTIAWWQYEKAKA